MVLRDAAALRQQAKEQLLPVYLLHGEDTPRVEAAAKWLAEQALDAFPEANYSVFDGRSGLDLDALAQAVWSMPFLAARRCVLLDDLAVDALGAVQADKLWQLLEDLSPDTTLIITVRTQPLALKKKGRGSKLAGACDKAGGVCAFPRQGRAGTLRIIGQLAKAGGCAIDDGAAGLLADYCALDPSRIQSEMGKLCAYGAGRAITREDVEKLVEPTADARVFDLSDKVVRGDLSGALETVDSLLFQREPPVTVLSILSMAFVDMYRAAVARRAGVAEAEAKKAYGYGGTGFRYTKGLEHQRRYTLAQLEAALGILADADSRMKSTGANPRTTLEAAVVDVFRCLRPK